MKTRALALLLASTTAIAPSLALAAPLRSDLGGPAGFGTNNFPGNDDFSWPGATPSAIDISSAFPSGLRFFGTTYHSLYLNNNGNITFGGPLGEYTPMPFPIASQPMIAPFWADVDTRGGGVPNRNAVYWTTQSGLFVATWHNVGYFSSHDDLSNDFQLILTAAGPGPGDFDVEFRYNQCQWTTGDASSGHGGFGGTPAQAGFDAGNLHDFVALPGSFTMSILNLCTTSNVGVTGVWRFRIRNGEVDCPGFGTPCTTGMLGVCGEGTNVCASPTMTVCQQQTMASDEQCNSLDDDCDGTTDESQPDLMCGIGACAVTQASCVSGMSQTCVPGQPHPETCNLVDDDCNGETDDNIPDVSCGLGVCRMTVPGCVSGMAPTCTPGRPGIEICNGLDDDCDGIYDNHLAMPCFIDAWVAPDAGPPPHDAAVLPDGARTFDAGAHCRGWECDPNRINGRAGPGCNCRVGQGRSDHGALALLALGLAIVIGRRLSRR